MAVLCMSPLIKEQSKTVRDTFSESHFVLLIIENLSAVGVFGQARSLDTNSLTFGVHSKKFYPAFPLTSPSPILQYFSF